MKCTEFERLVNDYVDNELTHSHEQIEEHIENCEACRALYEDTLAIKNMLSGLDMIDLPDDFEETLHEKLVAESNNVIPLHQEKVSSIKKYSRPLKWLGSIAAVMIVGITVYNSMPKGGLDEAVNFASADMNVEASMANEAMSDDMAEEEMAEAITEESTNALYTSKESTGVASFAESKALRSYPAVVAIKGKTYYVKSDKESVEKFILARKHQNLMMEDQVYRFLIHNEDLEAFDQLIRESLTVEDHYDEDNTYEVDNLKDTIKSQESYLEELKARLKEAKEDDKKAIEDQIEYVTSNTDTMKLDLENIENNKDYTEIIIIMNGE